MTGRGGGGGGLRPVTRPNAMCLRCGNRRTGICLCFPVFSSPVRPHSLGYYVRYVCVCIVSSVCLFQDKGTRDGHVFRSLSVSSVY